MTVSPRPGAAAAPDAPHGPDRPARPPLFVALVLVMGVGPFATDMYIAALPALRESLHTTATVAQLTLTTFIVGFALGQLVIGPISDARGRRVLLLAGAIAFTVLSVACALGPTGPVLVALRFGQGIVAGGGAALGRAVVTDTYRGDRAAAMFGAISSLSFLGPVVAPAIGGLILANGTWRTVFAALAGFGALMVVGVLAGIPETLPPHRRQPAGLVRTARRMGALARRWSFMRHVLVQCLATAGFFTYIGGSSFVLQTVFRVSPSRYTVVFATNAAAMAAAGLVFRLVVVRLGAVRLRAVGVSAAMVGSTALLAVAVVAPDGDGVPLAVPWALLCLVGAGMGLTLPATTALAQEAGRHSAGSAAALQGGLSFLAGALVTPLTGIAGYQTLLPMALMMTVFSVAAFVAMASGGRLTGRGARSARSRSR
ncbi:multidrug effflux MFS transporter [Actinomycetes bacterium KLBMP 9797]